MFKQQKGWQYLLTLLLVFSILLLPAPAFAADDSDEAETTTQEPFWDDLSYAKFLVQNYAFYELNPQVLNAKDVPSLIEALNKTDPWTMYFPAEVFSAYMNYIEGDYIGIGVYLSIVEGQLIVQGAIAGSPAEKAELKNGDIIVAVDGLNKNNATAEELMEALSGEENSLVTIKYERTGRATELTMNRKRIVEPSLEYWLLEDGIGYMQIWQFTSHTGEELVSGVKSLKKQGMKALIVDMRDCPGGEIYGAVDVCATLCGEGPMIFFVSNYGWEDFMPVDEAEQLNMPLAVLINSETASSAELVAANVQDSGTGTVIGVPSYGKGVTQSVIGLPSGAGIRFTTAKYISHGYQDVDSAGGVLPDIYVEDEKAQHDTAVAWLKEQLAQPTFVKFYVGLAGYSRGGEWRDAAAGAVMQNGTAYVPLSLTLTQLGWQLQERDGMLYFELDGQRLIVDVAKQSLITGSGSQALISEGGVIFLPASILRQFGYTVTWTDGERSVRIDK